MFTITLTFAILVALWGFSGSLVTFAKRSLAQARSRPEPVRAKPAAARRSRPIASA